MLDHRREQVTVDLLVDGHLHGLLVHLVALEEMAHRPDRVVPPGAEQEMARQHAQPEHVLIARLQHRLVPRHHPLEAREALLDRLENPPCGSDARFIELSEITLAGREPLRRCRTPAVHDESVGVSLREAVVLAQDRSAPGSAGPPPPPSPRTSATSAGRSGARSPGGTGNDLRSTQPPTRISPWLPRLFLCQSMQKMPLYSESGV